MNSARTIMQTLAVGGLAAGAALLLGRFLMVGNIEVRSSLSNSMNITSSAFSQGAMIPAEYTCDGANISPPLSVTDVPQGAQSLVLIVDDPDAPHGTWTHWVVWNITPAPFAIAAGAVPPGAAVGTTSAGTTGYHGPCPPSGTHRYHFQVYALNTAFKKLVSASVAANVRALMQGHLLSQADLVGIYSYNPRK